MDGHLEFVDKIRVRAVSVSWNSYLSHVPKLRSAHLPWLLHTREDNTKGISLYSPHEAKVYPLNLPEVKQKLFKGSSHGWVFTVDDTNSTSIDDIYLIHPLTRGRIQLPPRSTFPDAKEYLTGSVNQQYVLNAADSSDFYVTDPEDKSPFFVTDAWRLSLHGMEKIVSSSSPSNDNCVVVAIYGDYGKLAWCKCADKVWTPLHMYPSGPRQPACVDVFFHNGKLHALYATGKLVVFESIGPDPEWTEVARGPVSSLGNNIYLVKCCDGELIMLARNLSAHLQIQSTETC